MRNWVFQTIAWHPYSSLCHRFLLPRWRSFTQDRNSLLGSSINGDRWVILSSILRGTRRRYDNFVLLHLRLWLCFFREGNSKCMLLGFACVSILGECERIFRIDLNYCSERFSRYRMLLKLDCSAGSFLRLESCFHAILSDGAAYRLVTLDIALRISRFLFYLHLILLK